MHLLIVLVVALLVLGPKRLPGAGRALGHGLREFKDSISGVTGDDQPSQIPAAPVAITAEMSDAGSVTPVRELA
jgi:sec-independent protein translocase protein TatA